MDLTHDMNAIMCAQKHGFYTQQTVAVIVVVLLLVFAVDILSVYMPSSSLLKYNALGMDLHTPFYFYPVTAVSYAATESQYCLRL